MARQLRIKFDGAWYHVMNRGLDRKRIFFNSDNKTEFLNYLGKTTTVYGIEVHTYCFMDNHYHLIIHTPRGNISEAMKYLNSSYARYLNINLRRDGPVFKGRFKAIIISADDYLLTLSRYIHRNPVEAKMTGSLDGYKWSSYPCYVGIVDAPPWLKTNEIVSRFGKDEFSKSYKHFTESEPHEEERRFYTREKSSPVMGGSQFRSVIDEYVKSHSLSAEIVGADRILIPPDITTIIDKVAMYFQIDPGMIYKVASGRSNNARRIAIYVSREYGGYSLSQIGAAMGVSYKAISSTISRVKYNIAEKEVAEIIIKTLRR